MGSFAGAGEAHCLDRWAHCDLVSRWAHLAGAGGLIARPVGSLLEPVGSLLGAGGLISWNQWAHLAKTSGLIAGAVG